MGRERGKRRNEKLIMIGRGNGPEEYGVDTL
jgi:hypothetical protein